MAKKQQSNETQATVLYSPSGEKYETSSPTEIVRLRAYGYSEDKKTATSGNLAPSDS